MGEVRILMSVAQAAEALSISRAHLYNLLARHEIPSIRVGKARRIPSDALRAWVDGQLATQNPPAA